jgi:hypothetical protein
MISFNACQTIMKAMSPLIPNSALYYPKLPTSKPLATSTSVARLRARSILHDGDNAKVWTGVMFFKFPRRYKQVAIKQYSYANIRLLRNEQYMIELLLSAGRGHIVPQYLGCYGNGHSGLYVLVLKYAGIAIGGCYWQDVKDISSDDL